MSSIVKWVFSVFYRSARFAMLRMYIVIAQTVLVHSNKKAGSNDHIWNDMMT